jgi:hypothetical protein
MKQDDIVKNTEKLAWGARGRRFKSSHTDSFLSKTYDKITRTGKVSKTLVVASNIKTVNNKPSTADASSQQAFTTWYENPVEQQILLNLINTEGFILEDVVHETLSRCPGRIELHPGEVFEGAPHRGGGRVEIDLWAKIEGRTFLIESKRSDYDLVFLQNQASGRDIHIIVDSSEATFVTNRTAYQHIPCVSKKVIEVLGTEDTQALQRQQKKSNLPIRSSREEYVHSFMRQALLNMEVLLHNRFNDPDRKKQSFQTFIPIIVTNARLLSGIYERSSIDTDSKLIKIEPKPIGVVALNHAEILKCGANYEHTITHNGRPAHGNRIADDKRYIGSHLKTVFVVSKDHLLKFIDDTMSWT